MALLAAVAALLGVAGCGGERAADDGELRLGYFANVTHAAPILGLERGIYERRLAPLKVRPEVFLSGPEAVSSMLAGSIDAAYIGPGPLVTALSRAPGELRVVAGAGDAGAVLIAREGSGIRSVADLRGRRVAIPAHGNTQDLALRIMLERSGLRGRDQGGDVTLIVVKNPLLAGALANGVVDAAMAPEPWGSLLVDRDEARLVLDADEVLGGRYPTTILVVSEALFERRPDLVRRLVGANAEAVGLVARRPALAAGAFERLMTGTAGKAPPMRVIRAALARTVPTTAVSTGGMRAMVRAADDAGYLAREVRIGEVLPAAPGRAPKESDR